jgi:hypothetical protein
MVRAEHVEPEVAAHSVHPSKVPHADCRRFDGTVRSLEGGDEPAQTIGLLDDLDRDSGARQIVRGRKPGEPSADDRDGPHRIFERMGRPARTISAGDRRAPAPWFTGPPKRNRVVDVFTEVVPGTGTNG